MTLINTVYAQSAPSTGAPEAAPQQPGIMSMITLFAPMFLVIYFLIIRPQQKKVKEHQALLGKLTHGDEIISTSGIYGKVTGITDNVITVEVADGVRVKMIKSAVATVNPTAK